MGHCELLLRNGTVFDVGGGLDIAIVGGRIAAIGAGLDLPADQVIDLGGRVVVPGFVESHTHLDKAFTVGEDDFATLEEAAGVILRRQADLPREKVVEDIKARSRKVLDMEIVAGTCAVKSHVMVCPEWGMDSLRAINELKQEYRGRIDLFNITTWDEAYDSQFDAAARAGEIDFIAGYPLFTPDPMGCIDKVFALAARYGLPLDLHIDETDNPNIDCFMAVLRKTVEYGMQGRVTCGHVCALSAVDDELAHRAIEACAQAQVHVITLPSCNMYLMGRKDRQPVRRGVTRVDELLKAGVNVSVASDNIRDPYRPFGNGDLLEEALFAAQVLQYGTKAQLEEVLRMVTTRPARNALLRDYGLAEGCRADLVVLDAPTAREAVISGAARSWVFKDGRMTVKNGIAVQDI